MSTPRAGQAARPPGEASSSGRSSPTAALTCAMRISPAALRPGWISTVTGVGASARSPCNTSPASTRPDSIASSRAATFGDRVSRPPNRRCRLSTSRWLSALPIWSTTPTRISSRPLAPALNTVAKTMNTSGGSTKTSTRPARSRHRPSAITRTITRIMPQPIPWPNRSRRRAPGDAPSARATRRQPSATRFRFRALAPRRPRPCRSSITPDRTPPGPAP